MRTTLIFILAIFASFTATVRSQSKYTVTDLGVLPGMDSSSARGINALGHVTGNSSADSSLAPQLAFLYKNGKMQTVGPTTPQGDLSRYSYIDTAGIAINLFDQVIGTYYFNGFYNANGNFTGGVLGFVSVPKLFSMATGETPTGINALGDVVGYTTNVAGNATLPFVLRGGVTTTLNLLPGSKGGIIDAINNVGEMVGAGSVGSQGATHAVYYNRNGKIFDLGSLSSNSSARAINDLGWIAGSYSAGDSITNHAFLCYNGAAGKLIDLGILPNTSYAWPTGINNSGVIVGESQTGKYGFTGFVYANGVMRNINDLLLKNTAGWVVSTCSGINDLGQIAATGVGTVKGVGVQHALLLTPSFF